jgi:hypothetical protein
MINSIRADISKIHATVLESTNELDALIASGAGESAKLKRVVSNLHSALEGMPK